MEKITKNGVKDYNSKPKHVPGNITQRASVKCLHMLSRSFILSITGPPKIIGCNPETKTQNSTVSKLNCTITQFRNKCAASTKGLL